MVNIPEVFAKANLARFPCRIVLTPLCSEQLCFFFFTAGSRKVVGKKRKVLRDNPERYF